MFLRRLFTSSLFFVVFALAACDSAEERAEKHFQSAMELLEQGDQDRAIVEFRNVFKLNGTHREARRAYAELQRERGNITETASQYLRLVEQYPDDFPAQLALAEILADMGNWAQMEPHAAAAFEMQPENLSAQALKIVLDYQKARQKKEDATAALAVTAARELVEKMPENANLRLILIDDLLRKQRFTAALKEIDSALEIAPSHRGLSSIRLSVLATLGDTDGIEAHLLKTAERFPEDKSVRDMLIRFLVSEGRIDSAEAYLRENVSANAEGLSDRLILLQFVRQLRGAEAALQEVEAMLSAGQDAPVLEGLRASLQYDLGEKNQGIANMQAVLAGLEPGDEERNLRVALAGMMIRNDQETQARVEVDRVLTADAGQVEALKMRANWQIEDDQVGEAIVTLRSALDQNPTDAGIMSLMARAYERSGNEELTGEMLSLAVENSNKAPEESLQYARYLTARERFGTAESVLVEALRIAPGHTGLLSILGELYIATKDWPRAEQVIGTLRRSDDPRAKGVANALNARLLQAQQNTEEALAFLESLIGEENPALGPTLAIVRAHLTNGEPGKARELLSSLLENNSGNADLRFLLAGVEGSDDNPAQAEAIYRDLIAENPAEIRSWMALIRLMNRQGREDEADAVMSEALAAEPESSTLLWAKASMQERAGDIDGAIATYEILYAKNSSSVIVANNLASLLSSYRDDPAALDRAYVIARRLKPLPQAPFKDTWGWIAFLRGEKEEALVALEDAASRLPRDPIVQYHLGRIYADFGRNEEAVAQYVKVISLTTEADTRDFIKNARSEIARLQQSGESN